MDNSKASQESVTNAENFYTFPHVNGNIGWLFLPIKGESMQKVKIWGFYVLGYILHPLTRIEAGDTSFQIINTLSNASSALLFLESDLVFPASLCKKERTELYNHIQDLLERIGNSDQYIISDFDAKWLAETATKLENVLESQLSDLKTYMVSQTEWFSVSTLVEQGDELIPSSVRQIISDYAKHEMRQAGKCIAFNLPSAAGFHIIRALEDVLRKYYDEATGGKARPKNESMGVLIAELEKEQNSNKVILAALKQIKDLHRNPYIHDVVLTMKEVVVLLGIVQSAIAAIGRELIEAEERKTGLTNIEGLNTEREF